MYSLNCFAFSRSCDSSATIPGDGYVIVYSITSTTSFLEANSFRDQLYRVLDKDISEHVSIAVCGNKCDLEPERQVQTAEAEKLAEEWGVIFKETSAKNKTNITETFVELVEDIRKHKVIAVDEPSQEGGKPQKTQKKGGCQLL